MIDNIHQIQHNTEFCETEEKPSNTMGCDKRHLIDSLQVKNLIVSIMHYIIAIGNSFLDVFYEWIEWKR